MAAAKFGWREVLGSLLLFRKLRYFSDHSFYFLLHIARGCIVLGLFLGTTALVVMLGNHLFGNLERLVQSLAASVTGLS